MTDPIEPLKELARRWRRHVKSDCDPANGSTVVQMRGRAFADAATALESMLPALDAAFADLNERLENVAHSYKGYIRDTEAKLAALKDVNECLTANVNLLNERMACGHPKACLLSYHKDFEGEAIADECTACEHEHLAVAAAREELAVQFENCKGGTNTGYECAALIRNFKPADQKALDAHDAEMIDKAVRWVAEHLEAFPPKPITPGVAWSVEMERALQRGSK